MTQFCGGCRRFWLKTWRNSTKVVLMLVLLAGLVTVYMPTTARVVKAAGPSTFGFAYWPTHFGCNVLKAGNWNAYNKSLVAADMDHMASMGAGVIKLLIHPTDCGFSNLPAYSWQFALDADYVGTNGVVQNFPDFLRLAAARNLKVIIVFSNSWFYCGPNANPSICAPDGRGQWWEQSSYYQDYPLSGAANDPNRSGRFAAFLRNSNDWINALVDQVQASPYANTTLYYDYQNEYYRDIPFMGWYLTFLYDWSHIPAGKRGVSILHVADQVSNDTADLRYQLAAGASRHLDFVGFHSYPQISLNSNIEWSYDYVKSTFPDSTVLLDEFGYPANSPGEEGTQRDVLLDIMTRARNHQIPYYLNWLFDGDVFNQSDYSWSYSGRDNPKHIMGAFPQRVQSTLLNPDMEDINGSRPWHWSVDGSVPVQLRAMGPNTGDAATGNWYARMQATGYSSGTVWMYSDLTPVRGGDRLYLNGFIRSNMTNILMKVVEYDGYGNRLPEGPENNGPTLPSPPCCWTWNNYLAAVASGREGWSVGLRGETRSVIIMVYANVASSDATLDLDTVSVWEAVP